MTAKRRNEQGVDDGEKIDSHLVTAKKWNQQGVVHEVEQLDGSDYENLDFTAQLKKVEF